MAPIILALMLAVTTARTSTAPTTTTTSTRPAAMAAPTSARVVVPLPTSSTPTPAPSTQPIQVTVQLPPSQSTSTWWGIVQATGGALLGILFFVWGQWILKIFLDPIQSQRKTVGEIVFAIIHYRTAYARQGVNEQNEPYTEYDEAAVTARKHLNRLAAELLASTYTIPWYGVMEKCHFLVWKRDTVKRVCLELRFWLANMPEPEKVRQAVACISALLKVKPEDESGDKVLKKLDENLETAREAGFNLPIIPRV